MQCVKKSRDFMRCVLYMCVKCKCDAIWMQKRYLFIGRQKALMTALAHTFIMLLLLRPFITIAILLFIIIPLLGACTLYKLKRHSLRARAHAHPNDGCVRKIYAFARLNG